MKTITIDEQLYRYIASHTQHIGESASSILRRMLNLSVSDSAMVELATSAHESDSLLSTDKIIALLAAPQYRLQTKTTQRFLKLLSTCYWQAPQRFQQAAQQQQGRTRQYFARQVEILLASGKQTRPQVIPETPYWVVTNNNSQRKQRIVLDLMLAMGFSETFSHKAAVSLEKTIIDK